MTFDVSPSPARVLLLEDDPAIAKSIIFVLERDGLVVTHSLLISDAKRQLTLNPPGVLVLDIGLPDGSGLDLCKAVRAAGNLPMLILSAHGEEIDRVLGLELGADDYMTKPFSPRELLARVRSMLRRAAMQPEQRVHAEGLGRPINPFTIDNEGQRASLNGQVLSLTRREFGLLSELLRRPGWIRSRDDLLTAVWGIDTDSSDRTVDTHIKTLRTKLLLTNPNRDHIVTHRGVGYSADF